MTPDQKAERARKDKERRAETRKLYIEVFGSTKLLRGPEKRVYRRLNPGRTISVAKTQPSALRKKFE